MTDSYSISQFVSVEKLYLLLIITVASKKIQFISFSVKLAVPFAARGVFGNQGQMCFAASRLYVQSGIYEQFVQKAVEFAKNIKVGNPADPGVEHGPQVKNN